MDSQNDNPYDFRITDTRYKKKPDDIIINEAYKDRQDPSKIFEKTNFNTHYYKKGGHLGGSGLNFIPDDDPFSEMTRVSGFKKQFNETDYLNTLLEIARLKRQMTKHEFMGTINSEQYMFMKARLELLQQKETLYQVCFDKKDWSVNCSKSNPINPDPTEEKYFINQYKDPSNVLKKPSKYFSDSDTEFNYPFSESDKTKFIDPFPDDKIKTSENNPRDMRAFFRGCGFNNEPGVRTLGFVLPPETEALLSDYSEIIEEYFKKHGFKNEPKKGRFPVFPIEEDRQDRQQ